MEHFGYDYLDILTWINKLRRYHNYWYNSFISECVVETYDRYFSEIVQLKNTMMDSQDQVIRNRGYRLDHFLEEAYEATKLFVAAAQMDNERKRDKRFYDEENPKAILTSVFNLPILIIQDGQNQ